MGRKKTFVGTQIARVIEDDKLPNSVKKGATTALLTGGEIVDHILEEMVANIGVRAERLYDFAKQGNYVHGLPSGQFTVPGDTILTAVKAVLETLHGATVTMSYAHYGAPNTLHIGWMSLIEDYGYNPETNELEALSALKLQPVYLHDMIVQIPMVYIDQTEMASLEQWGLAARAGDTPERKFDNLSARLLVQPSPLQVSMGVAEEQLRVEHVWLDELGELQEDFINIPVEPAGYDDEANYFHARYTVGGEVKYWMYRSGAGTHPSLDTLFDKLPATGGEFFPFIYFRHAKVSEIEDKASESYKDNVKLTKYLGMDYDQVAEGVDANPDIDTVEQAMIMFALPANTENEQERAYLFEFFTKLYLAQTPSLRFQSEAQADIANAQVFGTAIQSPGIVVQDARFKMSLTNQGIYRIRKKGSIAALGQHSSGLETFNVITPMVEKNPDTGVETPYSVSTPVTYHYYRRQVTEVMYEELQVVELQTHFHINGQYSVTGDEDDKILLIPLDHSITDHYSIPKREVLYARALHYVFNSLTTITLKWYQTGLFQAIVIIVAVVITIWSWGADGGSALTAALAAGDYLLATQILITTLLEYIIAKVVFKMFVKELGAEAAFVLAIVAAVVGIGMGLESGGLAGSPWAQDLLQISSNLVSAVNAQIQADIGDLSKEVSEFDQYVKEQTKLLESAQELLESNTFLSPFVIFGEKPDEFYSRTVHSGNIGVVGIEAVSSFVDSKLTLPSLKETLGQGMGGEWNV